MLRREFMQFTAGGFVATEPIEALKDNCQLSDVLILLERKIRAEIPGITKLQIIHEPSDARVPLMVVAYRI